MLSKILAIAILTAVPSAAFATSGTYIARDPAGGTIRYPHDAPAVRVSNDRAAFRAIALRRDPAGGTIADGSPAAAPHNRR